MRMAGYLDWLVDHSKASGRSECVMRYNFGDCKTFHTLSMLVFTYTLEIRVPDSIRYIVACFLKIKKFIYYELHSCHSLVLYNTLFRGA